MKYTVFFHRGDELSLKTKVSKGKAWLDDMGLHIEGANGFTIPSREFWKQNCSGCMALAASSE